MACGGARRTACQGGAGDDRRHISSTEKQNNLLSRGLRMGLIGGLSTQPWQGRRGQLRRLWLLVPALIPFVIADRGGREQRL